MKDREDRYSLFVQIHLFMWITHTWVSNVLKTPTYLLVRMGAEADTMLSAMG